MNNMDQWVDPRVNLVKAASLHGYLRARGWTPRPSPRPQVLLFEEPPGHAGRPIVQTVPGHEGVSAYTDAVVRVITNLAAVEGRNAVDVLNDILRQTPAETAGMDGSDTAAKSEPAPR
jgi:hypothetical protein